MNHDSNFNNEETTSGSDFSDLSANDALTQILKAGAQKMLKAAIEHEVASYVEARSDIVDEHGRRQVVRNGTLPEREILTGVGPVTVSQPRVRDKRPTADRETFTPSVLPKYLRKTKSIEEMIPWLYLKGISTNDFPEALQFSLAVDRKRLFRLKLSDPVPNGLRVAAQQTRNVLDPAMSQLHRFDCRIA